MSTFFLCHSLFLIGMILNLVRLEEKEKQSNKCGGHPNAGVLASHFQDIIWGNSSAFFEAIDAEGVWMDGLKSQQSEHFLIYGLDMV